MNIQNVFGEGDSYNALLWSTFLVSILTYALMLLHAFVSALALKIVYSVSAFDSRATAQCARTVADATSVSLR